MKEIAIRSNEQVTLGRKAPKVKYPLLLALGICANHYRWGVWWYSAWRKLE